MSFTSEQLDVFYKIYKDPVQFVETFICELSAVERELLGSFCPEGKPRFLYHERDIANKVTFLYVVWASIFQIDTVSAIAVHSTPSRVALQAELLNILNGLPTWLIESVEVSGNMDCLGVKINDSCQLIICAADSYMFRGRTINTCVVQDLVDIKDPVARKDFIEYGSIFCAVNHKVIALYTNTSPMSIS